MAIIDLVKWNADDESLAWKCPSEELGTWTQLIVAESQEAMLVHGGQMEGPFAAGRHTLSTENLPILRDLMRIPFGGRSPFTAEVWFVNRSLPLDVRWEFEQPMQLQDPQYGVMLPVVASGQYGVKIDHTKRFLVQLMGTKAGFDRARMQRYLQGVVLTKAKDIIARSLVERKIPILHIGAHLSEMSDALKAGIAGDIERYGLKLESFYVTSIGAVDSDPAVEKLKTALAESASRSIQGYTYQQQRSLDVMQSAASNEGTAGGVMGAGIGLGMGMNVGNAIGGAMGGIASNLAPSAPPAGGVKLAASSQDRLALLKELGQMHKDGILTAEEFAREKAKILGQ